MALTCVLDRYIQNCFPEQTRKTKKNDAPWFNQKTRILTAKKLKIYKKEGKSQRYKDANRECAIEIENAKRVFLDKIIEKCKKTRNTKSYYKTVKMFQTKQAPVVWNIISMYPDKT